MRTLSVRQWIGVAWLLYILAPAGLLALLFGLQILLMPWIGPLDENQQVVLPVLGSVIAQLFIVPWVVLRFVRRILLDPLAAMSRAARQIAAGNLIFDLPPTPVREVAEVAAAFEAMGSALRDSLLRQADLEQQRRSFVAAIAHDLRTPLFVLRGSLQGLEQGIADTPAKARQYIAMCQEKAAVLESLIGDLFAYARLDLLQQQPRREPLDLAVLLQRHVEAIAPRIVEQQLQVEYAGPQPCQLQADPLLLGRVIDNLLDNALRHTPAGGTIQLSWEYDAERVRFIIADSGPGFRAQDLAHLFEPLYRGDAARGSHSGGLGLGLTIARRAMQAHGGDLQAANRPEGGAVLSGWLPLSPLPAPAQS